MPGGSNSGGPSESRRHYIVAVERCAEVVKGAKADLLEDSDELAPWFTRSLEWIGTLDPKPTKQ